MTILMRSFFFFFEMHCKGIGSRPDYQQTLKTNDSDMGAKKIK